MVPTGTHPACETCQLSVDNIPYPQVESVRSELAESKQALEAAHDEVECLKEMVTSWEEAFSKAQQELESLKVGLRMVQQCRVAVTSSAEVNEEGYLSRAECTLLQAHACIAPAATPDTAMHGHSALMLAGPS